MGIWKIFLAILFAGSMVLGIDSFSWGAEQPDNSDMKPTMQGFAQEMKGLKPYLVNPKIFESKQAEKVVLEKIENLRKLAEIASHKRGLKDGDYRSLVSALLEHLNETERNFKKGSKEYARFMLQSTAHMCISCHAQLPFNDLKPPLFTDGKIATSFEEAEYQFATRQLKISIKSFEKLIREYPDNGLEVPQLLEALNYTSIIFARIQRDPTGGKLFFGEIAKRKNLPPFIQSDVEAWLRSFRQWQKVKRINTEKSSDKKIMVTVREILYGKMNNPFFYRDKANQISYLRASGLLHELLIFHSQSKDRPEALYLLGICYLTLDQDFYPDLEYSYFKTCIKEYPESPFARKSYDLLAEAIYLGYSGSSGTHIPEEVEAELSSLKKLLKIVP